MSIGVPLQPPLDLWSPDSYANLADNLAERKRNYLRMIVGVGEEDGHRELAHVRGFINDGVRADGDANKSRAPVAAQLREGSRKDAARRPRNRLGRNHR